MGFKVWETPSLSISKDIRNYSKVQGGIIQISENPFLLDLREKATEITIYRRVYKTRQYRHIRKCYLTVGGKKSINMWKYGWTLRKLR